MSVALTAATPVAMADVAILTIMALSWADLIPCCAIATALILDALKTAAKASTNMDTKLARAEASTREMMAATHLSQLLPDATPWHPAKEPAPLNPATALLTSRTKGPTGSFLDPAAAP